MDQTNHASLFEGCEAAWDALARIADYIGAHLQRDLRNRCEGEVWIGPDVQIGEGTVLEDGVMIKGPALIGRDCKIRHNAYIRENVVVGDGCVVGNSCELKNSVLFNGCQVPHFNYVGDSILGACAHLGAGVKISNLKVVPGLISIEIDGRWINTGLRKFGALVGDRAQVGCNAVLNPGSILGRDSIVYPNVSWRGFLPARSVAKNRTTTEVTTLTDGAQR